MSTGLRPGPPRTPAVTVLDTSDVDEARSALARTYCPHEVHLPGDGSGFRAHQVHTADAPLGVFRLGYGSGPVVVGSVPFDDFVLVSRPLAGQLGVRSSGRSQTVGVGESVLLGSEVEHELRFGPGCRLLTVKIPSWTLDLARSTSPAGDPVPVLRTGTARLPQVWDAAVRFLLQEALPHGLLAADGLVRRHAVQLVAAAVISGFGHPPTLAQRRRGPEGARSAHVLRRALDFVADRAREDIGLLDIAAAAGTSPRSLQLVFRDQLGTTPLTHLRDTRLDLARADLHAGPVQSVADVAHACGFGHLGRFAAEYRSRFGLLPSEDHPGGRPARSGQPAQNG